MRDDNDHVLQRLQVAKRTKVLALELQGLENIPINGNNVEDIEYFLDLKR